MVTRYREARNNKPSSFLVSILIFFDMKTQKKLFLMRHAKSSWGDYGMSDFDRPLLPEGLAEAKKIVQANAQDLGSLQHIVSSTALRAMQTATVFCETLGLPLQRVVENIDLYLPEVAHILMIVKAFPNDTDSALIISHNPGVSDFVNHFLPTSINSLPTASIACLRFRVDKWADVKPDKLADSWVDYPAIC